MPSMTRHLGVALLAAAGLWSAGRASAICNNTGANQGCNYDCDCDCGYVCHNAVPKHCVLAKDFPLDPGHCDVNFTSCACRTGFGSTVDQMCVGGTCTPTWGDLDDGGFLVYQDSGPPPVPECQYDIDCGCGNHCLIVPEPYYDGGFHCVSFADAGGPTGGSCSCTDNTAAHCVSATCGCTGDTCLCDNGNCDDGGAGTCHAPDAGPPPPNDAGYDCMIDIDCPGGCGSVCSHAMAYWQCVPQGSDPGFCNSNLDCPCPSDLCDTSDNSCKPPAVDAGVDAGHDAGGTGTTGGTTGGGTTTSGGTSGGSSGCSSGGGLAGLGVLMLLAATLLSRRRELAGRR